MPRRRSNPGSGTLKAASLACAPPRNACEPLTRTGLEIVAYRVGDRLAPDPPARLQLRPELEPLFGQLDDDL